MDEISKRIKISSVDGELSITIDSAEFIAQSVLLEQAPCQPGVILWMANAKLKKSDYRFRAVTGSEPIPEIRERRPIVGFYVDRDGEPVDEELMNYIAHRNQELQEN